jgi:serine/threonine protein phosphatase PrpC
MMVAIGRQALGAREQQEDSFRIIAQNEADAGTDLLILVADGMGGHVGGAVASRLVVDVFEDHYIKRSRNPKPVARMTEALEVVNAALRERVAKEPSLAGMGSTLVAAMKLGNKLYWLSVGDSVLYLLRDGQLRRLNADHSVYGELLEHVREGRLTLQEADNHPRRNALRSAIVGDKIAMIDTNVIELQRRDLLVVASDGLDTLSDQQIAEIVLNPNRRAPQELTADLLNAVEAVGKPRQDNVTVVLYRYDPTATPSGWTDSLFRAPAPQKHRRSTPVLIGLLLALGLGGLVYAIGWGGRKTVPPVISAPSQSAPDSAEDRSDNLPSSPAEQPRGNSIIYQPERATPAPEPKAEDEKPEGEALIPLPDDNGAPSDAVTAPDAGPGDALPNGDNTISIAPPAAIKTE